MVYGIADDKDIKSLWCRSGVGKSSQLLLSSDVIQEFGTAQSISKIKGRSTWTPYFIRDYPWSVGRCCQRSRDKAEELSISTSISRKTDHSSGPPILRLHSAVCCLPGGGNRVKRNYSIKLLTTLSFSLRLRKCLLSCACESRTLTVRA